MLSLASLALGGCALAEPQDLASLEGGDQGAPPVSESGIIEAVGGLEGILTQNAIMDASKSPYYIIGDFIVAQGVTLDISPGTVLLINPNVSIYVDGILRIQGRLESPVTITSNRASPRKGDWGKIELAESGNSLQYVKIEYATIGISFPQGSGVLLSNIKVTDSETGLAFSRGASTSLSFLTVRDNDAGLSFDNSSPTIVDSKIESNGIGVSFLNNSSPRLTRNSIINNKNDGIVSDLSSSPVINESNIFANRTNGGYDIRVASSSTTVTSAPINVKSNWWGTSDETIIKGQIYDGDDDGTLRKVDYGGFKNAEVSIEIVEF